MLFAVSLLFIIAATWIHPRAISIAHDLFRPRVKRFELFVRNSLVSHASEILGGRKISRYPVGGFVERLGLRPVLLGIPCYWNMF